MVDTGPVAGSFVVTFRGRHGEGGRESALVQLSVVEQRLDAVRAVLAGARVTEVAASLGVSRQSVHGWLARYLVEGVPGLTDRSHRPHASRNKQWARSR